MKRILLLAGCIATLLCACMMQAEPRHGVLAVHSDFMYHFWQASHHKGESWYFSEKSYAVPNPSVLTPDQEKKRELFLQNALLYSHESSAFAVKSSPILRFQGPVNLPDCTQATFITASSSFTEGEVANFPACTTTQWSSDTNILITVGIHLFGAPSLATNIERNTTNFPLMEFELASTSNLRISGIHWTGSSAGLGGGEVAIAQIFGGCSSTTCAHVRIDNNNFDSWSTSANMANEVLELDNMFGSLDTNTITLTDNTALWTQTGQSVYINGGSSSFGDNSWVQPDSFGSDSELHFENNTITGQCFMGLCASVFDSDKGGGRDAAYFNTLNSVQFSAHGTESNGRPRSIRHVELFGNQLTIPSSVQGAFYGARGGTVRSAGNNIAINGSIADYIDTSNFRDTSSFNSFGQCNGYPISGTLDGPFDNNSNTMVYAMGTITNVTLAVDHTTAVGAYTDLSTSSAGSTTLVTSGTFPVFSSSPDTQVLYIRSGTNFVAGDYAVASWIDAQHIVLDSSPTPSGAGSSGSGAYYTRGPNGFGIDVFDSSQSWTVEQWTAGWTNIGGGTVPYTFIDTTSGMTSRSGTAPAAAPGQTSGQITFNGSQSGIPYVEMYFWNAKNLNDEKTPRIGDSYVIMRPTNCADFVGNGAGNITLANNPITTTPQWLNQVLDPIYEAGDTWSGSLPGVIGSNGTTRVISNYTYFREVSQSPNTSSTFPFDTTGATTYAPEGNEFGNLGGTGFGPSSYITAGGPCSDQSAYLATDVNPFILDGMTTWGAAHYTAAAMFKCGDTAHGATAGHWVSTLDTAHAFWAPYGYPWCDSTAGIASGLCATGPTMVFHTEPSDTHTGSTMTSFQVYATTNGSMVDSSFNGTVTLTDNSCGPSWSGLTATASSGIATFSSVVGTGASSGACNFTAAAMSYANGVSGSFWIGPNQIVFTTQPSGTYSTGPIATANQYQFGDNTQDTGSTYSSTISLVGCAGASIGGTTTQNASSGNLSWSNSSSGNGTGCTLSVTNGTLSVTSNSFNISNSGPTPPMITMQPQSQTITYGATASLSVTVTGTTPFTYQWYRAMSGSMTNPVGTNASTYTTPALFNTTDYWVYITNTAGSASSNTAVITINQPVIQSGSGDPRHLIRWRIR